MATVRMIIVQSWIVFTFYNYLRSKLTCSNFAYYLLQYFPSLNFFKSLWDFITKVNVQLTRLTQPNQNPHQKQHQHLVVEKEKPVAIQLPQNISTATTIVADNQDEYKFIEEP